jgi:ferric-dicitrate binding protein FerR (iron transport regulator)
MTPTPTPTPPDLVAHALGLLEPAERAVVDASLARDPALRRAYDEIAAHLRLYDRLPPAPPPPPVDRVLEALEEALEKALGRAPRRLLRLPARRVAVAAAALVVVGLGAFLALRDPGTGSPAARPLAAFDAAFVTARDGELTALLPSPILLGDRARVVLDRDARLRVVGEGSVRLESGRAWFDVQPGPFLVATPQGDVAVRGTAFEVDVRGGALAVEVESGSVDAAGRLLRAGEALASGAVRPGAESLGAWFRRPVLRLEGPSLVAGDEPVRLRLVFENPGRVPQEVSAPSGTGTSIWLSVTDPDGAVRDQPVPPEGAVSGRLEPGRPLRLGPGERRVVAFEMPHPSGPPGTYRYRALYRPAGQPPLPSSPLSVEVR